MNLCMRVMTSVSLFPVSLEDSVGKQVVRQGFKTADQRKRCVTNEMNYSVGRR